MIFRGVPQHQHCCCWLLIVVDCCCCLCLDWWMMKSWVFFRCTSPAEALCHTDLFNTCSCHSIAVQPMWLMINNTNVDWNTRRRKICKENFEKMIFSTFDLVGCRWVKVINDALPKLLVAFLNNALSIITGSFAIKLNLLFFRRKKQTKLLIQTTHEAQLNFNI